MLDALSSRRIRRFYLYREGLHAATIAAEPGRISFTARADDYHPFITAAYHNGFYEPELHALLRDSNSFDEFLLLLVPAGFDIVSDDMPPGTPLGTGVRLLDQLCPAAVCFTRGGQFTTLRRQPQPGLCVFPQARLTVYLCEWEDVLCRVLRQTADFSEFCRRAELLGLQLDRLANAA